MLRSIATVISIVLQVGVACAQVPSSIRLVVPFPAGGATDVLARVVAEQIGKSGGPPIIVDNRAGASTIIGTEVVARSKPDGATLLMPSNSFLINTHLRQLPYDPLTSFEPVCHLTDSPQVIAVRADAPFQSLADLVEFARTRPGALIIGANGPATTQHVIYSMLAKAAGISPVFVPYPGGAPATTAVLGGQVTATIANFSEVASQVEAGTMRVLAVTVGRRLGALPQVPTLKEVGYDIDLAAWFGIVAPAKTPPSVLAPLINLFTQAMLTEPVRENLTSLQLSASRECGADFGTFLRNQFDIVGHVAKESGMTLD